MPRDNPELIPRSPLRQWLFVAAGFVILALGLACASAAPLLRCKIEQGGKTQVLEFSPVLDPYAAKAVDINGRFRFKAVVVGDARQIEYIKIYTYDFPRRQPVLLHEVKYLAPISTPVAQPVSLTGMNLVYSPRLERELQYECVLQESAP